MMEEINELHDAIESADPLTEEEKARIDDQGDRIVITLIDPITFKASKLDGEKTVDTLTLPKKIKGKHLKKMDQADGEIGKGLALIAALAGVPAHAMDELDARDMDLCQLTVEPFLPKRRPTGRR